MNTKTEILRTSIVIGTTQSARWSPCEATMRKERATQPWRVPSSLAGSNEQSLSQHIVAAPPAPNFSCFHHFPPSPACRTELISHPTTSIAHRSLSLLAPSTNHRTLTPFSLLAPSTNHRTLTPFSLIDHVRLHQKPGIQHAARCTRR
jgi:hypothetical protein